MVEHKKNKSAPAVVVAAAAVDECDGGIFGTAIDINAIDAGNVGGTRGDTP